jgi:hypothetical protein
MAAIQREWFARDEHGDALETPLFPYHLGYIPPINQFKCEYTTRAPDLYNGCINSNSSKGASFERATERLQNLQDSATAALLTPTSW